MHICRRVDIALESRDEKAQTHTHTCDQHFHNFITAHVDRASFECLVIVREVDQPSQDRRSLWHFRWQLKCPITQINVTFAHGMPPSLSDALLNTEQADTGHYFLVSLFFIFKKVILTLFKISCPCDFMVMIFGL